MSRITSMSASETREYASFKRGVTISGVVFASSVLAFAIAFSLLSASNPVVIALMVYGCVVIIPSIMFFFPGLSQCAQMRKGNYSSWEV